jgi:hypothetical protein
MFDPISKLFRLLLMMLRSNVGDALQDVVPSKEASASKGTSEDAENFAVAPRLQLLRSEVTVSALIGRARQSHSGKIYSRAATPAPKSVR